MQDEEPEIVLGVDKVGVRNVKKKFVTYTPEGKFHYDVVTDAYIDLPKTRRGAHMSRDIEVFTKAIEEARSERLESLEEILDSACWKLLERHPYASRAELIARTRYQYEEDFTGHKISEGADVTIGAQIDRNGGERKSVTIRVPGMIVCPSAQATFHEVEGTSLSRSPSHSQRAYLTIETTTEGRLVRMERLIDAARRAFSAPVVSLLKRPDEHALIRRAFERPRFIEDLARHALRNVYRILLEGEYPEDTAIKVEAESHESIHPHNVCACHESTLGELIEASGR